MNIIGIGADIVDIRRIENILKKFGEKFENRVFAQSEIKLARKRYKKIETYAKRFAAKEACAKALGTGFADKVHMKNIVVVNRQGGQPELVLEKGAKKRLEKITPKNTKTKLLLTITDEYPYAYAQVIIGAIEQNNIE